MKEKANDRKTIGMNTFNKVVGDFFSDPSKETWEECERWAFQAEGTLMPAPT